MSFPLSRFQYIYEQYVDLLQDIFGKKESNYGSVKSDKKEDPKKKVS